MVGEIDERRDIEETQQRRGREQRDAAGRLQHVPIQNARSRGREMRDANHHAHAVTRLRAGRRAAAGCEAGRRQP